MAIFFVFARCSSWYTPFFQSTHFSWRKSRNKIGYFDFFEKMQKLMKSKCNFRFFGTPRSLFYLIISAQHPCMVIKKRRNVNPIKNGLIRSGRVTRFLGKPLQFLMGCTFLAISGHMVRCDEDAYLPNNLSLFSTDSGHY